VFSRACHAKRFSPFHGSFCPFFPSSMIIRDLASRLSNLQIPEVTSGNASERPGILPFALEEPAGFELDVDRATQNSGRTGHSMAYQSREGYKKKVPSFAVTSPGGHNTYYPGSRTDSYSSQPDSGISMMSSGDPWSTHDPVPMDLRDETPRARQASADINEQLIREAIRLGKERRRASIRGLERTHRWTDVLDTPASKGGISKHSRRKPYEPIRAAPKTADSPTTPSEASTVDSRDFSEAEDLRSPYSREGSWEEDERWLLSLPARGRTMPNSRSVYGDHETNRTLRAPESQDKSYSFRNPILEATSALSHRTIGRENGSRRPILQRKRYPL
jgi:hypothetical protein